MIIATLATLTACAFAGQFPVSAKVHTKQDAILFVNSGCLTVWQRFQTVATPSVQESYLEVVLGSREAWAFGEMPVKILGYEYENQVKVEMLTEKPKFRGSIWWLDVSGLEE
jgi:hypothetical protein